MPRYSLLIILFCTALTVPADAAPKAWESEREIIWNHGPIQVRMHKDFARNAEPKSFQADYAQMNYPVTALFRGPCSEYITLKVSIGDQRKVDVKDHIESGRGADLPIKDYLEAAVDSLTGQCPQIQVIRVEANPVYPQQGEFAYKGTLQRSNNWRLEDGLVKTAFDDKHTFEIKFRDMMSTLGVQYKGGCAEDTVIALAPMYANRQEATFADPPSIIDYQMMAQGVSQRYAEECPNVTKLRFSINPVPEDYECKDATSCFLKTDKAKEWEVDKSDLVLATPEEAPFQDLGGMVRVLADENYEVLKDYQNFFAFFYETFLELYSTHCRSHIQNVEVLQLQTIEVTSDDFFTDAKAVGPPRNLYLDADYVDSWKRYYQAWRPWGVSKYMSIVLQNQKRGRGPGESARWAMGYFTRNINSLEDVIRGNCMDETVQAAYRNMRTYAYMKNKPLNPRTKQMAEEFQSMTDMLSEGLGLARDAYGGNSADPAKQTTQQPPVPATTQPSPSAKTDTAQKKEEPATGPAAAMVGGWTGTIDGKTVELALWPEPGKPDRLQGYVYLGRHDCLMQADIYPYDGKLSFSFNSSGATNREGNCQKDLGGMPTRFQADGWITADSGDALNAELPFLIMGKPVAVSGTGEAPGATFTRHTASPEFKSILQTFEHQFRPKPKTEFIDSI